MSVPSAIAMIRTTCPDPVERSAAPRTPHTLSPAQCETSQALSAAASSPPAHYGGGYISHFVIAIMVIPAAGPAWFLLPTHTMPAKAQRRGVDIPGVLVLTSGLILLVYAISDGAESGMPSLSLLSFHSLENRPYPTQGWGSPQVVTTLLLSAVVFVVFFAIERTVKSPALPPKTWTNKNFTPLFFYAWSPYRWCLPRLSTPTCQRLHEPLRDSALVAAVRCIPMGVAGGAASFLAGKYIRPPPQPQAYPRVQARPHGSGRRALRVGRRGEGGGAVLGVYLPRDG
ncbi:hypothetical protein PLEOSDRAFT_1103942 [Pleurotus ostreatus PC15]|uniref:Uncharacterized protein n=1 Tax=Pleurotus ostreatus (strain PC15) TaxID=1137138 RepID=A0A067NT27_PLEO1|nr:hypothetical protein PLEOSDRAFT_1103942 [Pleurotus ostreatus PC15]